MSERASKRDCLFFVGLYANTGHALSILALFALDLTQIDSLAVDSFSLVEQALNPVHEPIGLWIVFDVVYGHLGTENID